MALLDRLLHSLAEPWDLSDSPLYRHLSLKEDSREGRSVLIQPILDQLAADPECAFLRELPEYGVLLRRYGE